MGRLVYGFNVSVDGYIADAHGSIDSSTHRLRPHLARHAQGRLEVAGATLAAAIVRAGLVDEYRIVLTPTAVGRHGPAALRGETRLIGERN